MRKANGLAYLYYYSDSATAVPLDTEDTLHSDVMSSTNTWYNYEVSVSNTGSMTAILGKIWNATRPKPDTSGIIASHMSGLSGGLAGIVSHAGAGNRYWGPMKVISSGSSTGAYLAYEDFREDTIVDVKPYTPAAMHPIYTVNQFTVGTDTTGFVFDKTGGVPSLIYSHRPGTVYPVTCQIAPYTNLEWRDYTFTDTIIKPVGSVYDSVDLYVPFYYTDSSHTYELVFNRNGIFLNGGGFTMDSITSTTKINGGDTLAFAVTATANAIGGVQDSSISIAVNYSKNRTSFPQANFTDKSTSRIKSGFAGIKIDYSSIANLNSRTSPPLLPIRFKGVMVKKASN